MSDADPAHTAASEDEREANRDGDTSIRPWRKSDGDLRCQECGRPNPVWYTDHDTWNRVMPDDGVLCIRCFIVRAEQVLARGPRAWAVFSDPAPFMGEFKRGFEAGRSARAAQPPQDAVRALERVEALTLSLVDQGHESCLRINCSSCVRNDIAARLRAAIAGGTQ